MQAMYIVVQICECSGIALLWRCTLCRLVISPYLATNYEQTIAHYDHAAIRLCVCAATQNDAVPWC